MVVEHVCFSTVCALSCPSWLHVRPPGASLAPSWAILGSFWGHLGRSWAHLGPLWGLCWAILGNLGAVLGPCWAISALSGMLLGLLFAISELSSILIGRSGRIWIHLGPLLGLLGPNVGLLMDLRACKSLGFCMVFEHLCFSTVCALSRPSCLHFRRLGTSLGPS